MSKLTSKYALLTILSLTACQSAPTLQTGGSPVVQTGVSSGNLKYKVAEDLFNGGLYYDCTSGKSFCRIDDTLINKPEEFKTVFSKEIASGSLSNDLAFELLFLAMLENKESIMDFILQQGVKLNQQGLKDIQKSGVFYFSSYLYDRTPPIRPLATLRQFPEQPASRFGNVSLAVFKKLLSAVPAEVRASFLQDMTYYAAAAGNMPVLTHLVEQGVDVHLERARLYAPREEFLTPLFYALAFGQPETSRFLIQKGARIKTMQALPSSSFSESGGSLYFPEKGPNFPSYQLMYVLATQHRRNVKQMMEIIINEPIFEGNEKATHLHRDLLAIAAGHENGQPEPDALEYLLTHGARSYGTPKPPTSFPPINNSLQPFPTPLNVIISQKRSFSEKKPLLELLLKFDPALSVRHISFPGQEQSEVEIADFLIQKLDKFPSEKNLLIKIKSNIQEHFTASNLMSTKPACEQSPSSVEGINSIIGNWQCDDAFVMKFALENPSLNLSESQAFKVLQEILNYRSHLLPQFFLSSRWVQNPITTLPKLLESAGKPEKTPKLEALNDLLEKHAPGKKLRFKADFLNKVVSEVCVRPSTAETFSPLLRFLDFVQDVNVIDSGGNSPLLFAFHDYFGQPSCLPVVKKLLDAGAYVNIADQAQETPLLKASRLDEMKLLLEHGAEVNVRNREGKTPILEAQSFDAVRLLLEYGADVNDYVRPPDWDTEMFHGYGPMSQYIYNKRDFALSIGPLSGQVLTEMVILSPDSESARSRLVYLLSQKAEISRPRYADLLYAFVFKAWVSHWTEVVSSIKTFLAEVTPDQRKALLQDELLLYTALIGEKLPVHKKKYILDVMQYFIDQGLDLEVHNKNYETPLYISAQLQFEEMYQLLLKAGANPNARDVFGKSAKEIHDSHSQSSLPAPQPTASAMP